MPEPKNPHDALFKYTFSEVSRAAAELRAVLPAEVLQRVDLTTLAPVPAEFVDESLAQAYSDLLFRAEVAGRAGFVYVLLEHQSSENALMALRLLGYIHRILDVEARQRRDRDEPVLPLPLVIPVVLHHSDAGWTRAANFHGLFDAELMADPALAALVPRFEFVLDDLSHLSDAELERRALDHVMGLTLWALRDARSPERIVHTVGAWLRAISQLQRSPHGLDALRVIFRYISAVTEDYAAEEVLHTVARQLPGIEETMTLAERWKAEGRAEGHAEGHAEGERSLLGRLLRLKFVEVPAELSDRIARASESELTRWAERVLSAATLEDVFAE